MTPEITSSSGRPFDTHQQFHVLNDEFQVTSHHWGLRDAAEDALRQVSNSKEPRLVGSTNGPFATDKPLSLYYRIAPLSEL